MKYRKFGRLIERVPENDYEFYQLWGAGGLSFTGRVAKQIVDAHKLKPEEKTEADDEEA